MKDMIVAEYQRQLQSPKDESRALQSCALELNLSLDDCADVLGLSGTLEEIANTWHIEFPETGQPNLRRP